MVKCAPQMLFTVFWQYIHVTSISMLFCTILFIHFLHLLSHKTNLSWYPHLIAYYSSFSCHTHIHNVYIYFPLFNPFSPLHYRFPPPAQVQSCSFNTTPMRLLHRVKQRRPLPRMPVLPLRIDEFHKRASNIISEATVQNRGHGDKTNWKSWAQSPL